jgi:hypothetical protein
LSIGLDKKDHKKVILTRYGERREAQNPIYKHRDADPPLFA